MVNVGRIKKGKKGFIFEVEVNDKIVSRKIFKTEKGAQMALAKRFGIGK